LSVVGSGIEQPSQGDGGLLFWATPTGSAG
jgi:hypothetical protein